EVGCEVDTGLGHGPSCLKAGGARELPGTPGRLRGSGLASASFPQPFGPWRPRTAHLGPGDFCPFSNSDSSFQSGQFNEDMIPTVGFNMRKITKGNLWDIGGQPRFRSMWERYCRGVSAIKIEASKNELHNLLDKPQLQGIPVSPEWSG
ncbi:hypothetical protein E2I00_010380, partial [Balaenoptera physalus]